MNKVTETGEMKESKRRDQEEKDINEKCKMRLMNECKQLVMGIEKTRRSGISKRRLRGGR